MKSFFYCCLTTFLCFSQSLSSQEPSIETVKISEHFYVLYGGNGQGSNVGVLIQEEGILLVDAMVAESGEKLLAAIRQLSGKPIKYVLNTHGDFDHSGGNQLLAEQGTTIIAHENAVYNGGWSQMTFKDKFSLRFGNETIRAWHSPSHSNSDITIYIENENALFLGDTFSNVWHPTFYATGMAGQYKVLEQAKVLANDKTSIIPGHGFVTDLKDIEHYEQGCQLWMTRMTQLHNEGKTLESMITDSELLALRRRFTEKHPNGNMPDMNFQRLIQRTISSEFVEVTPLSNLAHYTGVFQNEEGIKTKVFLSEGRLMAAVEGEYMVELLPVAPARFYLRAWIDHFFEFKNDDQGKVTSINHLQSDGKSVLTLIQH